MNENEKEFKDKVEKLLVELNNKTGNKNNVTVFVYNVETNEGFFFGYGCPGCSFDAWKENYDMGFVQHTQKSNFHTDN